MEKKKQRSSRKPDRLLRRKRYLDANFLAFLGRLLRLVVDLNAGDYPNVAKFCKSWCRVSAKKFNVITNFGHFPQSFYPLPLSRAPFFFFLPFFFCSYLWKGR